MGVFRNAPSYLADTLGSGGPSRASQYSDAMAVEVYGGSHSKAAADEGTYFTALNTTPGTGIAGHIACTTADPTKPLIFVQNNGVKRITMDTIALRKTAVPGTGPPTTADYSVFLDAGAVRSSAGTALTVVNTNSDVSNASGATVYLGPTIVVNGSAQHLAHRRVRSIISKVEDQIIFSFGYGGYALDSLQASTVATQASFHVNFPPVVLGPGDSMLFVHWAVGQTTTGDSVDVEVNFIER